MRLLEDSSSATYYHVTFETRVPSIQAHGLQVGKRRNWDRAIGGKQGSLNHLYLFDNATGAVRWGFNMEWEFGKPVAIIVIKNPPGMIAPDDHIQMQLNGYGAVTTDESIPPSCIHRIVPVTDMMKKQVASTGQVDAALFEFINDPTPMSPTFRPFKNLPPEELIRFCQTSDFHSLRGLAVGENNYYWDARVAIHGTVARMLGIEDYVEDRFWVHFRDDMTMVEWTERFEYGRTLNRAYRRLMTCPDLYFQCGSEGWLPGPEAAASITSALKEGSWDTTIPVNSSWRGVKEAVEIFKNPSRGDIAKMGGDCRMLISRNGDLLFWEEGILHSEVEPELDTFAPHLLYSSRNPKDIWWNELESYKLDHAWDIELDHANDEVYYDARLRGDWQRVMSNPNVQRLCGGEPIIIGIDEHYPEVRMDAAWIARNVQP